MANPASEQIPPKLREKKIKAYPFCVIRQKESRILCRASNNQDYINNIGKAPAHELLHNSRIV